MKPFAYARPANLEEALPLLSAVRVPKGAGMDLLDLAKRGVSTPEALVDVRALRGMTTLEAQPDGALAVGAGVTLAVLAASEAVRKGCPALGEAAADAATPQVRNVATVAGSLLQRPRCAYFRDPFFDCLKRGGRTCPAREGEHREGAVLGNGLCCATHPSNLAVALVALGAEVSILTGPKESRAVPLDALFVAPEEDPLREARVAPGEIVALVRVPRSPASAYAEVNHKQSFDWAAASCAVSLAMEGGKVKAARVVLGAVAPVPWRSKEAEAALAGKVPDERSVAAAAEAALRGATPLRDNRHKVHLAKVALRRAVLAAAARGR